MKVIHSLRVPHGQDSDLTQLAAQTLGIPASSIASVRVTKRSLDARNRRQFYWVYSLEVFLQGEAVSEAFEPFPQLRWDGPPPLIIGAGPAGLFAAWTFLAHGIQPVLFERGERTHERLVKISRYWRHGALDPDSNVCNGEGGAGTFSDGKLITRIKSPYIGRVMQAFVDYGAPDEITYAYNPHVGSNLIRNVIRRMCDDLIARGSSLNFNTRVAGLDLSGRDTQGLILADGRKIPGTGVILACGHSAGDFFHGLRDQGVHIESKPFAIGVRLEHPQAHINAWQYGTPEIPEGLEPAQYRVSAHWEHDETGVYSFCMCPGGYVISSSTDADGIVVNGMSNYHRNSPWANAAIVCTVTTEDVPGDHPFKMLNFQRDIERATFAVSREQADGRNIPAQHLEDFFAGRTGQIRARPSCPSGAVATDLATLLPKPIVHYLKRGLHDFERKRRGFLHTEALLYAVESRTSSPIRITRDDATLESINTKGLFPCGEGPGYAGGITSAAVDGIRAALAWIRRFQPPRAR